MPKKEKTTVDTTDAEVETEETTTEAVETETEEETETETESETEEESSIDYAAELKVERERREKAEQAAADLAFKARKAKKEAGESEEEDEDEKPLTKSELKQMLAEDRQANEKRANEAKLDQEADKHANSDAERELIKEYYRNRIVPSGNLAEDMEIAAAAVNRKRVLAENSELKRALKSKDTRTTNAAGTQRDSAAPTEPKIPPREQAALKAGGYKWNPTKQRYELETKKRILYVDPKSGERGQIQK